MLQIFLVTVDRVIILAKSCDQIELLQASEALYSLLYDCVPFLSCSIVHIVHLHTCIKYLFPVLCIINFPLPLSIPMCCITTDIPPQKHSNSLFSLHSDVYTAIATFHYNFLFDTHLTLLISSHLISLSLSSSLFLSLTHSFTKICAY